MGFDGNPEKTDQNAQQQNGSNPVRGRATMHCADVIEKLAASAEPASAALAEHLAHCPDCAAWAARDARLAQLWEATRPQEPTPEAWATVWAEVSSRLATAPARVVPLAPIRPWQRWAPAAFGIAQAAAILAAAVWLGSRPSPAPVAIAQVEVPASKVETPASKVEIPASYGALVMISTDGTDLKIASLVADEGFNPSFDILGKLESMAAE
jgi:hypothetical protein